MQLLSNLWSKIPVIIRAFITGLLVLMVAVFPSSTLLQLNITTMSAIPWAVPIGGLVLWLWWRYLGGWGAPASNADRRRKLRRFNHLPAFGQPWIWFSAGSLAVTIASFAFIKTLTEVGAAQQVAMMDALEVLPAITAVPLLIGLTAMTGFFEETAFRGYMQLPLEERFGPIVAIAFVAFIFAGVHFPALGQFPLFFFGSLGWGVLVWLSGTILPGIVFHSLVDGCIFIWAWANPGIFRSLLDTNVLETGLTGLFKVVVAIAIVGTATTIYTFVKIHRSRPIAN